MGNQQQSATQRILKPLIELQCEHELKASKLWQASSLVLTTTQLNHAQNKICECVGNHALSHISTKDLVIASVDETVKNKVIQQALINSLKGCVKEAFE